MDQEAIAFISSLEEIVKQGLIKRPLPVKVGNDLKVGNLVISRSADDSYAVMDFASKSVLESFFSIRAAIAYVHLLQDNHKVTNYKKWHISNLDKTIEKNFHDRLFLKSTIDSLCRSKDSDGRLISLENRYEVAEDNLNTAISNLEHIIYG